MQVPAGRLLVFIVTRSKDPVPGPMFVFDGLVVTRPGRIDPRFVFYPSRSVGGGDFMKRIAVSEAQGSIVVNGGCNRYRFWRIEQVDRPRIGRPCLVGFALIGQHATKRAFGPVML